MVIRTNEQIMAICVFNQIPRKYLTLTARTVPGTRAPSARAQSSPHARGVGRRPLKMRAPGHLAIFTLTVIVQTSWVLTFSNEGTDCGRVVASDTNGRSSGTPIITWHAMVYRYNARVSSGTIISAYHVLSSPVTMSFSKSRPVTGYSVMGGKLYKYWKDERDVNAQKREVADIKVPEGYKNSWSYESNIAVIILETSFVFNFYIRPICLSFDEELDRKQLTPGNTGVVVVWSSSDGPPHMNDFSYIDKGTCVARSSDYAKHYFYSDTICGYIPPDQSIHNDEDFKCGQSLAFPEMVAGVRRYYLRGLKTKQDLNFGPEPQYFTHVLSHEKFLIESLAAPRGPNTTYVPVGSNFVTIVEFLCEILKIPECNRRIDTQTRQTI